MFSGHFRKEKNDNKNIGGHSARGKELGEGHSGPAAKQIQEN